MRVQIRRLGQKVESTTPSLLQGRLDSVYGLELGGDSDAALGTCRYLGFDRALRTLTILLCRMPKGRRMCARRIAMSSLSPCVGLSYSVNTGAWDQCK